MTNLSQNVATGCKYPRPAASNPVAGAGVTGARPRELALADDAENLLIQRLRQGDQAAFDQFVAIHQDRVARLAHRLLAWPDDADDVVQDVFLAAWRGLATFRGQASLATWLVRLTINQCRSRQRRRRIGAAWLRECWHRRASQSSPGADDALLADETADQVRAAVRRLPPRAREVIVLHYLESLSPADVAQILNVRTNTVEVRLHRARQRLKKMLDGIVQE